MSRIASGVAHTVPADMRRELTGNPTLLTAWNGLTPLARNEWICWTISVKQAKTREGHLRRMREEVLAGKKRPCCWPGCPHRK